MSLRGRLCGAPRILSRRAAPAHVPALAMVIVLPWPPHTATVLHTVSCDLGFCGPGHAAPRSASPLHPGDSPLDSRLGHCQIWPLSEQGRLAGVHSQPPGHPSDERTFTEKGALFGGQGGLQDSVHPNPVHGQSSAATTSPLGGPSPCTSPGPPLLPPTFTCSF